MSEPANEGLLRRFYEDEELYDEVERFLFAHLDQLGLKYIYDKQDVSGVADAKIVLENAFKQLEQTFGAKDSVKKVKNESR